MYKPLTNLNRFENLVLDICFLMTQLKNVRWLSIVQHLSQSSEVFHSHSSCCFQKGFSDLAEADFY